MPRLLLFVVSFLLVSTWLSPVAAAPTQAQLCESAMELASAKYAQCRLTAQSKDAKATDPAKLTEALAKCSRKLSDAFNRSTLRYAGACSATEPSSAFDEYLKQCSDDTVAAVGGAALPNYLVDLDSCIGDLSACNGGLATCNADLATTTADLTTCEGDLAACEALPPARLLKTGQTTAYGAGSDGDLEVGVAQGYVDNGDGTITDRKTGLVWEKKSDDDSIHDKDRAFTWGLAIPPYTMDGTISTTFLATLNSPPCFAGQCDWRVPNLRELESLVNLQTFNPATFPAFNTGCSPGCTVLSCSCTLADYYWSSSSYTQVPQLAWPVNFHDGQPIVIGNGKGYATYVRAVRGGS